MRSLLRCVGVLAALALLIAAPLPLRAQGGEYRERLRLTPDGGTPIGGLAWNTEGDRIAFGVGRVEVQIWDIVTEEQVISFRVPFSAYLRRLTWQPGGSLLAASLWQGEAHSELWDVTDYGLVLTWDTSTGEIVGSQQTSGPVQDIAWSPDGTQVVFTVQDRDWHGDLLPGYAALWDGQSEAVRVIAEAERLGAAWSPDGTSLALGCTDSRVEIVDPATGEVIRALRGNEGWPMFTLAWNPTGETILGQEGERDGSNRCGMTLWDAATGDIVPGVFGCLWLPAWSPDGQQIAGVSAPDDFGDGGNPHVASIFAVLPGNDWYQAVFSLSGHYYLITALAWSSEGLIATAGQDRTVRIWEPTD